MLYLFAFYKLVATVTILILLEQLFESYFLRDVDSILERLSNEMPKTANKLLIDGRSEVVAVDALKEGDTVRIVEGEWVPVDGVLFSGEADVEEYGQTVHKVIGSHLYAASKVVKGTALVRTIREKSLHSQRVEIASTVSFQQQIPDLLFIVLGGLACLIFLFSALFSGFADGAAHISAVLLAVCPAALLLSDQLVKKATLAQAALDGIVIRSFKVFSEAANCNMLVVNKNGTLTVGRPSIVSLDHVEGVNPDELLQVAASLEAAAVHPYAQCIVERAVGQNIALVEAENLEEVSGLGVKGKIAGEVCQIGDEKLLGHIDLSFYKTRAEDMRKQGYIVLFCAKGHKLLGIIVLTDPVRRDVKDTLKAFKNERFTLFCLSGDRRITVVQLVGALGFDRFQSEAPSAQKIYTVQKLQKEGRRILMVGDPHKDEAALVQANVGAALGTKGDLLQEKAPIVLLQGNLSSALTLFNLAKLSSSVMTQNRSLAYAFMAIFGLLALFGVIGPVYAAVYMLLSTLFVGLNTLRLQKL
ncbi:MAG: cation-translocating P-type ATPase [Verrucomicrobia bacterium]|nr:cation-translocating P-type ATPase [Verrucomicrobiota bacterium]